MLLSACVVQPKIDPSKFVAPRTVALVDVPRAKNTAVVGIVVTSAPDFHFAPAADYYFVAGDGSPPGTGDYVMSAAIVGATQSRSMPNAGPQAGLLGAGVGAGVGAIIDVAADATNRRAQQFDEEVLRRMPDYNLSADFMAALRVALDGRGVKVSMVSDFVASPPRLLWPATDVDGKPLPIRQGPLATTVDADLLVQVSPVALYNAPGQLNAYAAEVGVGIALYEGRTRKFIGRQNVRARGGVIAGHHGYQALVDDIPQSMMALRASLLELVPQVTDIVAGGRKP